MSITPMMQQYLDLKKKYEDCILFFRLGDFYEMFFKDAEIASKELEITLTGRDCGLEERAPMCGVPFHAADTYIARLVNKGYKVAICEQMEDPALAKGIVRREVIKIITPGTITDESMLDGKKNNYIMSVYKEGYHYGICSADISTGELSCTKIDWGNTRQKLIDEIARFAPSEIVVNKELFSDKELMDLVNKRFNAFTTVLDDSYFLAEKARKTIKDSIENCDILHEKNNPGINAVGALLSYLLETQKSALKHLVNLNVYEIEEYMILDSSTRRNLEITETMRDRSRKGTLLWVLDRTMTSMGARCLRKWIEQPLIKKYDICERLEAVGELKEKFMVRSEIRELLKPVYDMERLMSKIVIGNINCRDFVALKKSIGQLPYIRNLLRECTASLLNKLYNEMDELNNIYDLIEKSIMDDPPLTVKEGGIIKDGYNAEVDKLREASLRGKEWIAGLEAKERERTGIKNLRVGYNKVFGYYIEVTKSNYSLVPDDYIRKQTLVNCERYITPELKEIENTILGAEDKVMNLEYELFLEIREKVAAQADRIKSTAQCIACLDALCSLAETADRENYTMPEITNEDTIKIIKGRHPVVEKMLEDNTFVPNDTFIDMNENMISIITGPNMAGKSTYMRQNALIVLMAQMGSFVPAEAATIGIVDRIFTRVGASDDLASGQSTFMVEMNEVANILNNATPKSFLILDEIGRGTSTYDGLSIAWAVVEYISEKMKCRTLFATHYHELTELEGKLEGVKNYCVTVDRKGDDIIFLRKIKRGGADGSFGIQVAKMAGLPSDVLERADEILKELEALDISKKEARLKRKRKVLEGQMDIFSYVAPSREENEIIAELKRIDINNLTPLDALNKLNELASLARRPGGSS